MLIVEYYICCLLIKLNILFWSFCLLIICIHFFSILMYFWTVSNSIHWPTFNSRFFDYDLLNNCSVSCCITTNLGLSNCLPLRSQSLPGYFQQEHYKALLYLKRHIQKERDLFANRMGIQYGDWKEHVQISLATCTLQSATSVPCLSNIHSYYSRLSWPLYCSWNIMSMFLPRFFCWLFPPSGTVFPQLSARLVSLPPSCFCSKVLFVLESIYTGYPT